jgi:nitroreductase
MDAIEAIHTRRSVRDFSDRPVERKVIEDLLWDAAQTPPPHAGDVPWTFTVIQGAERIADLGRQAMDYARQHRPEGGGSSWLDRDGFKVFWNAPVVLIICGPIGDCCRAGQVVLLAAHARGLGACWVGAPDLWLSTAAAKEALQIPVNSTPRAAICLGYARSLPERRDRSMPHVTWVN